MYLNSLTKQTFCRYAYDVLLKSSSALNKGHTPTPVLSLSTFNFVYFSSIFMAMITVIKRNRVMKEVL